MIYFNQAATTYPKPEQVRKMVERCITVLPFSQYRSVADEQEVDYPGLARRRLSQLFGIPDQERIFFTSGATEGLNMAILGWQPGQGRGGIVVTAAEHNSVLRPVMDGLSSSLKGGSRSVTVVPCDRDGRIIMEEMERAVTAQTGMVILNHCSNVTGALQDAAKVGRLCKSNGAVFVLDASQSAGVIPVDVEQMQVDMLIWTGHKSLFGIQGSGGIYIRKGLPVRPILFGGTGYDSKSLILEEPAYETGTANMPGIASMAAGVGFIQETGLAHIYEKDHRLITRIYEGLKEITGVTVYGSHVPEGTAVAFGMKGISPSDAGYILSGSYGIQVRTGLHCAPFIHDCIGSGQEGCVRVSISYFNTEEEVDALLQAVGEIAAAVG